MLGPLRETPASTAQPMPAAGSEHQGRSLAASHTMLPGLGLAQCGPAQAERLRAWGLVSCSLSLPGGHRSTKSPGQTSVSGQAKAS